MIQKKACVVIVKILLVNSWTGQLIHIPTSFLKVSIVYVTFLSSLVCMSLLIPGYAFSVGEGEPGQRIDRNRETICSEPKFSIGRISQDFS